MACIFCKIRDGEIPATVVMQDEHCLVFEDINPAAPIHLLVIPREHIETLNQLSPEHDTLIGHLIRTGAQAAAERGVSGTGFRTVINCNKDAGQEVFHLHVHVIGGRKLSWPPG